MGGVVTSLFMGAIFLSCHSLPVASANEAENSHALPTSQSLNEPCCMAQSSNYSLHSLPLAAILSTTTSQNSALEVTGSPTWFQDAVIVSTYVNQEPYLNGSVEVPLYSYLTAFIAQGLLQPQIYSTHQASA